MGEDRLNFQPLMAFCYHTLGWTPEVFWHQATMADILAALDGAQSQSPVRLTCHPPAKEFMDEMVLRFPDR